MSEHADKSPENKLSVGAHHTSQLKSNTTALRLEDNCPAANRLRALQEMAGSTPRLKQLKAFQQSPVQQKENKTGLPDQLKAGVENLSGHSLDDVKVHYNSGKPKGLQALAYAQGTDIHLAPGQEKHLPHEAWHVAQQKQGRVRPTIQAKGAAINDDPGLEQEADVMGSKALQSGTSGALQDEKFPLQMVAAQNADEPVAQRMVEWLDPQKVYVKDLVNTVLEFTDFGITPVILNQVEIPGGNTATALYGPTFRFTPATKLLVIKGFDLSVQADPVNLVGYRVELPTPPPWTRQIPFNHAKSAIEMLKGTVTGDPFPDDDSIMITLRVGGLPNDGAFADLVDQHEDHHVNELREIIGRILTPWDNRITEFREQQRTLFGRSQEGATADFYAKVGGTPANVGEKIESDLKASGDLFHGTHGGGSPTIAAATYHAATATIAVTFSHPGDFV